MTFLLTLHSWLRWLLAAALLGLILHTAWLLRQRGELPSTERRWLAAFSGLMDLQVLLGTLFFFWSGLAGAGFPLYRIEHLTTMLAAAGVAHLPSIWMKKGAEKWVRRIPWALLLVLALIYLGVSTLPGR